MRLILNANVRTGAAVLLLAATAVTALAATAYFRGRGRYQLLYTKTTKQRDIADSARNAMSALQDAELQAQHYVLTGETVYSEAYARDVRTWQDESGTAAIVAQHDPSAYLVHDLSEQGASVLKELEQTVSLYDQGSIDAALNRLRKGTAIVYLGQIRETVAEILRLDSLAADETNQSFINGALQVQRRLIEAAACLFALTICGFVLMVIATRDRRAVDAPASSRKERAAVAR